MTTLVLSSLMSAANADDGTRRADQQRIGAVADSAAPSSDAAASTLPNFSGPTSTPNDTRPTENDSEPPATADDTNTASTATAPKGLSTGDDAATPNEGEPAESTNPTVKAHGDQRKTDQVDGVPDCPVEALPVPDGEFDSLRWAVAEAAAQGCETVEILAGTHVITLGEILIDADLTIIGQGQDSVVTASMAGSGESVFAITDASVTFDSLFLDGSGQARLIDHDGSCDWCTLTVVSSTFINGSASVGGAVRTGTSANVTTIVVNSNFTSNTATLRGGAIDAVGGLTIESSTFTGNAAGERGGAAASHGDTVISASLFEANTSEPTAATHGGGAVFLKRTAASPAMALVTGSTFTGNSVASSVISSQTGGGAIKATDIDLEIIDTSFTQNVAASFGGAIHMYDGDVAISTSRFVENDASLDAAVLFIRAGDADFTSSAFIDNSTSNAVHGLLVSTYSLSNDVTVSVRNSVIDNPTDRASFARVNELLLTNVTAASGNRLTNDVGTASFESSYLESTTGTLCESSAMTGLRNYTTDESCGLDPADNTVGGPLSFIESIQGEMPIWTPTASSPLINANPAPCPLSTDQIGTQRPLGSGCDIGAIEYAPSAPVECPVPALPVDDGDVNSLRWAINQAIAVGCDTVEVNAGVHALTMGEIVIEEDLAIVAAGGGSDTEATVIAAAPTTSLLNVLNSAGVQITSLTFDGAGMSRAVRCAPCDLTILDSTFVNGHATVGGALQVHGGTTSIVGSNFSWNKATEIGGAISSDQNILDVTDSTFAHNKAGRGGAIRVFGNDPISNDATVNGSTFTENEATDEYGGGAIFIRGNPVAIAVGESDFSSNTSTTRGGAISAFGSFGAATVSIDASTFTGNTAASMGGGAIEADSPIDVSASHFIGNEAVRGGAINVHKNGGPFPSSYIDDSTFLDNIAFGANDLDGGGAVRHRSHNLFVTGSSFDGNSTAGIGGAAFTRSSTFTVDTSSFKDNSASNGGTVGMHVLSTLRMTQSSIADSLPNAVYAQPQVGVVALAELENTLIHNNAAIENAAAFVNVDTVDLDHVTVRLSGHIAHQTTASAPTQLVTNRSYLQSAGAVCGTIEASVGANNWVTDGSCDLPPADNTVGASQNFELVTAAGIDTLVPVAGSPLIDALPTSACQLDVDQVNALRPAGLGCDIGAIEAPDLLLDCRLPDEFDSANYNVIVGSDLAESILGTQGPDFILAFGGDDFVLGNGGDDVICAGLGDDSVVAGSGNDFVSGQGGNDTILGQQGDDALDGGSQFDDVRGGTGDDELWGGPGTDALNGGAGHDACHNFPGDDSTFLCELVDG